MCLNMKMLLCWGRDSFARRADRQSKPGASFVRRTTARFHARSRAGGPDRAHRRAQMRAHPPRAPLTRPRPVSHGTHRSYTSRVDDTLIVPGREVGALPDVLPGAVLAGRYALER